MPFYPGPGIGGHCIPLDPHYLSWKMKTLNYKARFIELASEINSSMPQHIVDKVVAGLNEFEKSVKGSNILVIGVAYKPNIDDVRESPALDIIALLQRAGANVSYHDPHVAHIRLPEGELRSQPLTEQLLSNADCVVIATNHKAVDLEEVAGHVELIVDTRNTFASGHSIVRFG